MLKRSIILAKVLCILFVAVSCTKKEVIYSKEDMIGMVPKEGPEKMEILLARNLNDVIPCSDYGAGCLSAHRLRVKNLDFIAIEFNDGEQAMLAAQRIRGWTVSNWLFDDVEGEPVLERWLVEHYKAKRFISSQTATDSVKKPAESAAPSPAN